MADELRSVSREREIVDLAGRQQGLLTHAQLKSIGVGRRTIDRWLASGRLHAVYLDVYRLGPRPLTDTAGGSPRSWRWGLEQF